MKNTFGLLFDRDLINSLENLKIQSVDNFNNLILKLQMNYQM